MQTTKKPVVFSFGMGADSTAILLRWIMEPECRDFDLQDLVVVIAQTGDEWPITGRLVDEWIIPLLAQHRIRTTQAGRAGPSQRDGITVFEDTRTPTRAYIEGDYTLADEMFGAGTLPQSGGPRRCSAKAKGWVLDRLIASIVGSAPYRHVIGFEAEETSRSEKDTTYNTAQRTGEYPLIQWGWDRRACEGYILKTLGVAWPKSACTYCPFALANREGRARVLERFASDPRAGVNALLMEFIAVALNPRQGLIGGKQLLDLLGRTPGLEGARNAFYARLDELPWRVCEVRRVLRPREDDPTKVANGVRSLTTVSVNGAELLDRSTAQAALAGFARQDGLDLETGGLHTRAWKRRRGTLLPAVEHFVTAIPSIPPDKVNDGFDEAWAKAMKAPHQPDLLDLARA